MQRTFTATADVETLAITADSAQVKVVASEETTEATIEISGPAEAVREAEVAEHAGMWSVYVPEQTLPAGGTATNTVTSVNGGTVIQSNGGMIIGGGGNVTVNGVTYSNPGGGPVVIGGGQQVEPVTITARVPRGIRLSAKTESGSLRTLGYLREVSTRSVSGNTYVATAGSVQASSVSGGITVSHADTATFATSVSGDVDVRGGADIEASTTSGDVSFASTRACRLSATSKSGDITLVRQHDVQARVSTTSGDIRG